MIHTLRVGVLGVGAAALGAGLFSGAGPAPAGAAAPEPPAEHVVVVGVAGLRWSDVNATDTPTLAALARSGSTGSLSVRSATEVTCPGEGWLTLGAGAYAAVTDPGDVDPAGGCAPRLPPAVTGPATAGGPATVPALVGLRELNAGLRFGARPGTLGDSAACATAVGPGAALAAAGADGRVGSYHPALPESPAAALARCPVSLVDLGAVAGAGDQRRRELTRFDRALARIRTSLPPGSVLMVLGLAETQARQPHLHVAAVAGPGFGPGWLRSPSTHRVPYVQLVDVTPTVLAALGREVPQTLPGRPLAGRESGRPDSAGTAVATLIDTDTQAVAQRAVLGPFAAALAVVLLAVVVAAVWLLRRARRQRWTPRRPAGWLSLVALGLSAVPAASFVANLVPWWRAPAPLLALAASVVAVALVMVSIAIVAGHGVRDWAVRIRVRLGALAAMTLLVFVADAVTGASLQLGSLLGYNPLVAGRFIGFGNIAFAVYAVAGVLLAALLAHGRRQAVAAAGVTAVAVPVVVFDGLPWWGADFGGVLTLVPTFVVLGLLAARARVTWRRLALAAAGGLVLVLVISWLDYLRPASERSHFGRFLVSVLDGSAAQTIRRKLLTNLDLLVIGPHSILAALLVIVGVVLLIRPPPALRRVYQTWPAVRTGFVTVLVLAGFGFATNDSGIAIPSVMSLVILPTVVALCVWVVLGDPWHEPPRAPLAPASERVVSPTR